MLTYYGKAWLEACRKNLNTSEKHLKRAIKLNGIFDFRVWDGPDGKDRRATWTFDKGRCVEVTFQAAPAPWKELREMPLDENSVGRFSCPYDMMAKLNKGEIGPLKALSSPEYELEGKKNMVFKMMMGLNSWNDHNAQIDCIYEFTETDDDGNAIL